MIDKIKKYKACSPLERRALVHAFVLLPLVKVSLVFRGFRRTHKMLSILNSAKNEIPEGSIPAGNMTDQGQSLARVVEIAGQNLPFEIKCLPISMVTQLLLRRRGIPGDLRIGVKRFEDDFEAHAWVELDGHPLRQRADQKNQFSPFSTPITPPI